MQGGKSTEAEEDAYPGAAEWEGGVTNRRDGEAESQRIVAARLLYRLQYLVPYLSRLQRIHLPDRLELRCKAPRADKIGGPGGSSRHMLLGAHRSSRGGGAPLLVVGSQPGR